VTRSAPVALVLAWLPTTRALYRAAGREVLHGVVNPPNIDGIEEARRWSPNSGRLPARLPAIRQQQGPTTSHASPCHFETIGLLSSAYMK
jgi:hypothetical protein